MSIQKTLSIIKPDATARNLTGIINARFEQAGLRIIAQKRLRITREQVEKFYEIHREKAFYESLCEYMSSGPVVAQVLCGEDAVAKNREIMGATNPANAEVGTIRRDFGESIEHNAVHGSDSLENAEIEIRFFFSQLEIIE
ncbi:MAG: nucleoside-diphosphate kinase [Holosporaceae bacterium]|jgi:nucleoside-diphosphate kinase|nr:nucleoside-diphosphate kinase [Holosporaceae bacterium]